MPSAEIADLLTPSPSKSTRTGVVTQLKRVASASKDNIWVSPFRPKGRSPHAAPKQEKTKENEPLTEPATEQKSDAESETQEAKQEEAVEPQTETTDTQKPAEPENEPVADTASEEALEETTGDVVEDEEPIGETEPAGQSEPLVAPADEIEATFDKPKMLNRYKENKLLASQALNNTQVQNMDRVLNLGAGLKLTEAQIYEIAKKRVAPVLKQVDEQVQENFKRDELRAKEEEEKFVKKDESKLAKELKKYTAAIEKENAAIMASFAKPMKKLDEDMAASKKAYEQYIADVKAKIEQDAIDYEEAEKKAAEKHVTDKEGLHERAEQRRQELTEAVAHAKEQQEVETQKEKEVRALGEEYKQKADEAESQLSEKEKELEDKIALLEGLVSSKYEKQVTIAGATRKKLEAERKVAIIDAQHAQAKSNADKLQEHVNLIQSHVDQHQAKKEHLSTEGQKQLDEKRSAAEKAIEDWELEKQQMRTEEARRQERLRIEAEAERKRLAEEEERKRKEEELAAQRKEQEEREAKERKEQEEKEKQHSAAGAVGVGAAAGVVGADVQAKDAGSQSVPGIKSSQLEGNTAQKSSDEPNPETAASITPVADPGKPDENVSKDVAAVAEPTADASSPSSTESSKPSKSNAPSEVITTVTATGAAADVAAAAIDAAGIDAVTEQLEKGADVADIAKLAETKRSVEPIQEEPEIKNGTTIASASTPGAFVAPITTSVPAVSAPGSPSTPKKVDSLEGASTLGSKTKSKSRANSLTKKLFPLSRSSSKKQEPKQNSATSETPQPESAVPPVTYKSLDPAASEESPPVTAKGEGDFDSIDARTRAKPVFTEVVDNDDYQEVITYETVDSAEYEKNKHDPNYMKVPADE
ncbi:hypothetical protein KL905_001784 [Ogataea polymorpha]|nr:hypothetical protein KL905_001784 [Ogataea polymorpha]